jgi:hypothetical protein
MPTPTIDTWAVDLADVTLIYPWVGTEGLMAVIGIVLWLAWLAWQVEHENETNDQKIQRYGDDETIKNAMDEHH